VNELYIFPNARSKDKKRVLRIFSASEGEQPAADNTWVRAALYSIHSIVFLNKVYVNVI